MKRMPESIGQVAACAVCFESYIVLNEMTAEEKARFTAWLDKHGVGCQNTPLTRITASTFAVLANLEGPGH